MTPPPSPMPATAVAPLPEDIVGLIDEYAQAVGKYQREKAHRTPEALEPLADAVDDARSKVEAAIAALAQQGEELRKRIKLLDNVIVEHHSSNIMREEHDICPVCDKAGGVDFFVENAALARPLQPARPS